MAKNNYISGVNWASLKKFAKHIFGDLEATKITKDRKFIIYINKKTYYDKKEEVERFEDDFLVNIKPIG